MAKLVVLSGVPGSGKSYFTSLVQRKYGGHVYSVSSDALRNLVGGGIQNFENEQLIWKMYYELPKVWVLDPNGIVIMDATQTRKEFRYEAIKQYKDSFDSIDLVMFTLPDDVIKEQNVNREWVVPDKAMDKFFGEFSTPLDEEEIAFFDHIYFLNNRDDFFTVVKLI
ncbi:MAG: AAA family ATPase [Coprobacillus sp.]|nr:AAA family ATPase [Coprobacillus sp.]